MCSGNKLGQSTSVSNTDERCLDYKWEDINEWRGCQNMSNCIGQCLAHDIIVTSDLLLLLPSNNENYSNSEIWQRCLIDRIESKNKIK